MPAAEAAALSSDALLRILLKGGLSTSRTVTDTSGRGVGMDVVREAAERLGGEVDIRTEVGLGTTIELRVPLSLASFEALAVEVSGTTALIPFDAVRGSLRISPDAITRTAHQRSIQHDGATIPLGSLARAIAPQNPASAATGPATAVVVQGPTSRAAFGVDRILGTATIVLRPLPPMAPAADFIAGASLDVEGVPRLVLEPDGLVAAVERELGLEREAHHVRRSILVVDDSLTTRMLEQSILESAGYEVGIAASGEEALEKARGGQYALFLVDIEMPGMDGFAFIERARADPNLRDVPSILVSSRSSSDDRRRGQEVGAQAYIVKSEFDQGVLLDRIKRLVA
jgi:two-component system chemotaxis sensor kinase CheA